MAQSMTFFVKRSENAIGKKLVIGFRQEGGQDSNLSLLKGRGRNSSSVLLAKFEKRFPSLASSGGNEAIKDVYARSFYALGIFGHEKGSAIIFMDSSDAIIGEPLPPEVFISSRAIRHLGREFMLGDILHKHVFAILISPDDASLPLKSQSDILGSAWAAIRNSAKGISANDSTALGFAQGLVAAANDAFVLASMLGVAKKNGADSPAAEPGQMPQQP